MSGRDVTLRLSEAEAADLHGWLMRAVDNGITLRQEAASLALGIGDRLHHALPDENAGDTAPVPQDTDRLSDARAIVDALRICYSTDEGRAQAVADFLVAERERGRAEVEQALAEQRAGIAVAIGMLPGHGTNEVVWRYDAVCAARAYRGDEG